LMCSRDSTWLRQMGHLLVCLRSSWAHSWHMHLQAGAGGWGRQAGSNRGAAVVICGGNQGVARPEGW
jgi:hypothetical protein